MWSYLPLTKQHSAPNKRTMDMAAFDTTRPTYGSLNMAGRISSTLASLAGSFATWNNARITSNALAGLTNRELEDIGLVRGDIDLVAHGKNFR
jgi:uncharacterized protein YjiS (DUF1127 family)